MKQLIMTDVDGTLTRKSVVLSHCGFLIKQGIIEDDGSFKAWSKDMKNEALITATAENYRSQITGLNENDMMADTFIENFVADKEGWYSTFRQLQELAKDKNNHIVLITGSSDFLIKHLANFLNADYYATEYLIDRTYHYTGEVVGMFSAEQKDDCIQWNINTNEYDLIQGWGDTFSDYGIFKHADIKKLVAPTRETLKRLINKIVINEIIEE